nr:reverse transcriptase domain-containing protein [Pectinatus cerevisiiphilus]
MTVGEVLDEEIYENSYGNRLKKTIDIKNKKDIIEEDKSPRLFSPYFLQYEKWRNNALEVAENILKNNQDAIILTLDFQRFYYNIDLLEKDKDDYYNLYTTKNGKDTSVRRLNEFVFEVISKYSENNRKSYKFLPINFYPSNIISNYYLKEFDNKLIERWNPSYYGRYVDDIIIVDKVEKNSQLYLKMKKNQLDKACIINYFLCGCNGNKNDECCKKSAKEFDSSLLKFDEKEKYYYVNENIIENRRRQLRIQDQKVNIFYFNELGSNALLDKFKKELRKNTSEFRYLPEDDATLVNNDYSEIYDLKNNDSINKLNSIEDIQINKYSLSKYLGKLTRIDLLIDDTNNNKFYADILKIFDNKNIVLNYMTWEKVLQIFLTNKKFEIAKKYILSIVQIISEIKYTNENQDNRTLRKTLMLYLYRSMSR